MRRSFDTETGGLEWFEPDQRAFLTTWSDERGNDHLAHQSDARAMAAFKADMERSDVIAAHNLSFDVHQTRVSENGFDLLKLGKKLVDTADLARVVAPERRFAEGDDGGFDLDSLSKTYLPAEDQKIDLDELFKKHGIRRREKGSYLRLWQVEPEAVEEYAKKDTRATIELLPVLERKIDKRGQRRIWELECAVKPVLIEAEAHGVRVDQAKVEPLLAKYSEMRDRAYDDVVSALGPDALAAPDEDEASSKEALREALIEHGIPLYRLTKSGDLAVNQPALNEFKHDFPVIQRLIDYRTAAKFLSTYIEPMVGRERVHTTFNQLGAWTGRMSSRRPNMQNLPVRGEGSAELREMFIPDEGYCWVVSDFDQIELRYLAYYLNNEEFIRKIESGHDVFAELAADLAYIRDYADELGDDMENYRKGKPGARYRSEAKNGTYAIMYGIGAAKLSDNLGLPPGPPLGPNAWKVKRGYARPEDPSYPVGTEVIKKVKSWFPGYWNLMSTRPGREGRIIKKIQTLGHVNTIMGRHQPVDPDRAYVGLSALIQGSAADTFKQAVINVAEALRPYGGLPVMFIHDEIGSLVPIEHAEECLRLQDEAMMAAVSIRPALQVNGTIAYNNYAEGK